MKTIMLSNGIRIPQIGMGVFRVAPGIDTENLVRTALETGFRHIDTATAYRNESDVGKAIRESGIPREEIFLTTKMISDDIVGRTGYQAFNRSMSELGLEYVDLYLIHWPEDGYADAWHEMEKIYKEGRAKAIGVSNFLPEQIEKLEAASEILPMVNQVESNPYFSDQEVIDYCQRRKIAVEIHSPLGSSRNNGVLQNPVLKKIAEKYGKSIPQIVLRWEIQRDVIIVQKTTHRERMLENLNVFDFELTVLDMETIYGLNKNSHLMPDRENFSFLRKNKD